MTEKVNLVDILGPRKTQFGIFKFMTRSWKPQSTFSIDKIYSPQELKDVVVKSVFMDCVLEAESARSGVCKETLKKEVLKYMEEMGMDRKMHTIRWMGVVFLKVCFMMKIGVFVNESAVLKLKTVMGNNPVLFLPTHRGYADFCLMTYLCYHYDVDIPAVAAGMDFYSMVMVGQRMRETGAFYIRRTLVGAPLYAATLKHYVRTLVTKHCAPLEFFIEGTRSRSNKCLPPKYGMISMTLVPYFTREVSDITIVPVNISYDRLVEQTPFAYEHLGVPKPKESTGGLLRSMNSLNDHYGNIYINLASPISLREYLGEDYTVSGETAKPLDLQQLTPHQQNQVQDVANLAVTIQQECTVVTISNLISIVVMDSMMRNVVLEFEEVLVEMDWLIRVLGELGATVHEKDVRSSVERILVVHRQMIRLDKEKKLRLVPSPLRGVTSDIQKKMKGHILKAETMSSALPVIQVQMYVNPVLHYLVPPAIIYLIVKKAPTTKDKLACEYHLVRKLLRHEFFHIEENEEGTFNKALDYCLHHNVLRCSEGQYSVAGDGRLQFLLQWSVLPALTTLLICADVMIECVKCGHARALQLVQEAAEAGGRHPYCLSLEAANNCLQGLVLAAAATKHRRQQEVTYEIVDDVIQQCRHLVGSILPNISVDFRDNPVLLPQNTVACRL